ncbi:MAG: prepilin-type N-terminal cleavage/methylation domain-containing protein [Candidatus Spechtbacterales bacterium]
MDSSAVFRHYPYRGFSLIELLVVVSIIAILASIAVGVYVAARPATRVDAEAQKIQSALRLAHSRTVASENFEQHGVHFDASNGTYTLFAGEAFDSNDPDNEEMSLEGAVSLSNVQLVGGGTDIMFSRVTGITNQHGFIELISQDSSQTRAVCVLANGTVFSAPVDGGVLACSESQLAYTEGSTDADLASFPSGSGTGDPAQTVTIGAEPIIVGRVDLLLKRVGTPSDLFFELREGSTVGTVRTTSTVVAGSSLPVDLSWVSFELPLPVTLNAATQYALRLRSWPTSNVAFSGAEGTVHWGYEHAATAPPAYGGGDAWRYVGANGNGADAGQQLGPADQYDFSFRLIGSGAPLLTDSRHLEINLGYSLQGVTNITLDYDNGASVTSYPVASYMNADSSEFHFEETVTVGADELPLVVHSHYIDGADTVFSIVRDRRFHNVALSIRLDATTVVSYAADGTATAGSVDSMIYR